MIGMAESQGEEEEEEVLSRIRFIDATDGLVDSLQVLRVTNTNNLPPIPCSVDHVRQSNLCRERKIFVKAALQLIDSHEVASAFTSNNDGGVDAKFDVIRSGVLMKGVRSASLISSMGLSSHKVSSTGSFTWKSKYVELRHGQFAYYDDASEDSTPLMGGSLHSYHPNFNSSSSAYKGSESHRKVSAAQATAALSAIKKVIPLYAGSCTCRAIRLSQHHQRGHSGGGSASNNGISSAAKTLVPLTPGDSAVESGTESRHRRDSNPELVGAEPAAHGSNSVGTSSHMTGTDGHAFEICQLGGQRRLFLAGSAEECARWVRAINIAMISGAAVPVAIADGESDRSSVLQAGKQPACQVNSDSEVPSAGSASMEGAAGPYARDIARFIQLQQRLHGAEREEDCRGALQDMINRSVQVRVPVAYIKGKCADSRFAKAATTSAASPIGNISGGAQGDHRVVHTHMGLKHWIPSGLKKQQSQLGSAMAVSGAADATTGQQKARENVSVEHSQMWKDLQRDEVSVNGEKVAGNNDTTGAKGFGEPLLQGEDCDAAGAGAVPQLAAGGAEAIIGLLVRHIADAAEQAKTLLTISLLAQQSAETSGEGDRRITSNKVAPNIQGMSESHMVQCARSILMMCNRTQSGGDTYYCVDSLLSKRLVGGDNLFILAPVSNKAEPLTINVDVVEVLRNRTHSQRDSGKYAAVLRSQQQAQREKLLNAVTAHKQASSSAQEGFTTPGAPAAPLSSYNHMRGRDSPCNDYIDALAASTAAALSVDSPLASTAKPNILREREVALPAGTAMEASGAPVLNLGDAASGETARGTSKGASSKPVSVRNPQLFARRDLPPPPVAASLGAPPRFDLTGSPAMEGASASGPASPPGALTKSSSTKIWEVRPGRSPRRIVEPSPPSAQEAAADSKGDSLAAGSGPGGPMLRRRSSRKSQLKLSIDDEFSYCDSGPSSGFQTQMQSAEEKATAISAATATAGPAHAIAGVSSASKALRSDFAVILQRHSSTGSGQSDADSTVRLNLLDETGDADDENTACEGEGRGTAASDAFRESNDTVPASLVCLKDEHRFDGGVTAGNLSAGKDDSTVISDITFDTTAAFSQNTSVASYLRNGQEPHSQSESQPSQLDGMQSVEKGKKSGAHKPKSLLKLIASRLTPRHQRTTSSANSVPGSPAPPQAAFTPSRPTDKLADDGDSTTTAPRHGTTDTGGLASEQRGAGNYHRGSKSAYKPTPNGHARSKLMTSTITEESLDREHLSWRSGSSESAQAEDPAFCIRLRVHGVSRYRVCSADPQGVPEQDNWATMVGVFSQTFFVPAVAEVAALPHLSQHDAAGNSNNSSHHGSKHSGCSSLACKLGKLAMTDRVVTISTEAFDDGSSHY